VFSQQDRFRLLSDHLVQKGPAFPRPLEMSIDAGNYRVTVMYTDDEGKSQRHVEPLDRPADLANGLVLTLLKNVDPGRLSLVRRGHAGTAARDAQRARRGQERFSTGGASRQAVPYMLHVHLGGFSGLFAPLFGKQPPDSHVWILGGEAPAFVKAEQPLYAGEPVRRIELVSPVWPAQRNGPARP
jgi:hypothetical protein